MQRNPDNDKEDDENDSDHTDISVDWERVTLSFRVLLLSFCS